MDDFQQFVGVLLVPEADWSNTVVALLLRLKHPRSFVAADLEPGRHRLGAGDGE